MLVFLDGASTANSVITVKLNSNSPVPRVGQDTTVMGCGKTYGGTNFWDDIMIPSDNLLYIDVDILSNQECATIEGFANWIYMHYSSLIMDNMMCARRLNGQGSCQGGSGGPMVIKGVDGAADVQVGVILWVPGSGCAATNFPDIYAHVSQAYDGIESEVCKGSSYATKAGFDCSSIPANPPISIPTNPPTFSPNADGGLLDVICGWFDWGCNNP
jgi:secreted trypsin-like serine protease